MPITALHVTNFKGISEQQSFPIRKITLFIGPNSSGKSSCIHALGCLAQTLKLTGSASPIVLDDEFAQLHLGRFVEIIHSRSYADSIELGVTISGVTIRGVTARGRRRPVRPLEDVRMHYSFRSTKRTQEMYLDKASFNCNERHIDIKRRTKVFDVTDQTNQYKGTAIRTNGFLISLSPLGKEPTDAFFDTYNFVSTVQRTLAQELKNTLYLGPFRQPPQRRYPSRGTSPVEVGTFGEATVSLLANEYLRSARSRPHQKEVGRWLSLMGLAKSIDLARLGTSDLFELSATLKDGVTLPLADLGYGVSQALPVLVQCSFAPKGSTLLFEQPELHLHAGAAKMLGKVLLETANQKSIHIIAETHSPELFWQFIEEIRQGELGVDDFVAYKVKRDQGKSVFDRIGIEKIGPDVDVLDPWKPDLDKP